VDQALEEEECRPARLAETEPSLAFFDASKNFIPENWRRFKQDYYVTYATMRVLLDQPGETFSEATQVRSKNKSLEELLPIAKAWFKDFLMKRKYFEVPGMVAYVQKYNIIMDTLGMWPENTWDQIADKPRLGLINFCFVLGQDLKAKSSVAKLFFKDFMDSLRSDGPSILDDLDVRVWICGNKKDGRQVFALTERSPFAKEYKTFIPRTSWGGMSG
jgi:hypothetical protein